MILSLSFLQKLEWNFRHDETNRAEGKDRDDQHDGLDGEVLELALLQDLATLHLLHVPHTPPRDDVPRDVLIEDALLHREESGVSHREQHVTGVVQVLDEEVGDGHRVDFVDLDGERFPVWFEAADDSLDLHVTQDIPKHSTEVLYVHRHVLLGEVEVIENDFKSIYSP